MEYHCRVILAGAVILAHIPSGYLHAIPPPEVEANNHRFQDSEQRASLAQYIGWAAPTNTLPPPTTTSVVPTTTIAPSTTTTVRKISTTSKAPYKSPVPTLVPNALTTTTTLGPPPLREVESIIVDVDQLQTALGIQPNQLPQQQGVLSPQGNGNGGGGTIIIRPPSQLIAGSVLGIIRETVGLVQNTISAVGVNLTLLGGVPFLGANINRLALTRINATHFKVSLPPSSPQQMLPNHFPLLQKQQSTSKTM